jgi:hypothetical protein
MTCQWQLGVMTLMQCGEPATGACSLCGRPLCIKHMVMGMTGAGCPQCAANNEGFPRSEDTELAAARQEYYRPYGGAPGFGSAGYFSAGDSAALNDPGLAQKKRPRKDYDAMET